MRSRTHPKISTDYLTATEDGDIAEGLVDMLIDTLKNLEPGDTHLALAIKMEALLRHIERLMGPEG